jgi:hypothetical protein
MRPNLIDGELSKDGLDRLLAAQEQKRIPAENQRKEQATIVLGIDPGPVLTGWCEFDGAHVFRWGFDHNEEVRRWIRNGDFARTILAVEDMTASQRPFGNSIRDTLLWIHGRNGICAAWGNEETMHVISRTAVKLHLCGRLTGHGDSEVWKALVERFGRHTKKEPNPVTCVQGHARAALAVAVTVWDRLQAAGVTE